MPHLDRCCRVVKEKFTELFARSFELPCFERPTPRGHGEKVRVGFLVTPVPAGGGRRRTRPIIARLDGERFEPVLIYHQQSEKRLSRHFWRADLRRVAFSADNEPAVMDDSRGRLRRDLLLEGRRRRLESHFYQWPAWRRFRCTSWSTHGTSGSRFVDYYVSWDLAETTGAEQHYTERLFQLDCSPLYERAWRFRLKRRAVNWGCRKPAQSTSAPIARQVPPKFDAYLREILCRDSTGHVVLLVGKTRTWPTGSRSESAATSVRARRRECIFLPQQSVDSY